MKQISFLILLLIALFLYFGSNSQAAALTPPAAQAKTSDNISDRLDSVESRVKELGDKIDHVGLKDDYTQQIQKQYEAYYEKAFSTQIEILTILGIILTALFFFAGRFGLKVFDRQLQLELTSATNALRSEFEKRLAEQLKSLGDVNAARVKELESALRTDIATLETDLRLRSEFQFESSMGAAAFAGKDYDAAKDRAREALAFYKQGKDRHSIPLMGAIRMIGFVFASIREQARDHFAELAKQELTQTIYQGLEKELAEVAIRIPELGPLLKR